MPDPTATHAAPELPPQPATSDTVKETIEAIVVAFILAFVFRAYVVEAFVIPTGSMAPTLRGEHISVVCPECGYRFEVEVREDDRDRFSFDSEGRGIMRNYLTLARSRRPLPVVCPMCQTVIPLGSGTHIGAGDRILVQKYLYSVANPQRWDVVVFKAPHEPEVNYIKRLIGLPNEDLRIIEGRIYVRSTDPSAPPAWRQWHIARSELREDGTALEKVPRARWQPVYHSQYIPLDYLPNSERTAYGWQVPWSADPASASRWQLARTRSYRYSATAPATIHFDFEDQIVARDPTNGWQRSLLVACNQLNELPLPPSRRVGDYRDPVEDVRLAAVFRPELPGLTVRLQTEGRWALRPGPAQPARPVDSGRPVVIAAVIGPDGVARLELPDVTDPATGARPAILASAQVGPFLAGRARQLELWNLDQEASLWIDGRRILSADFDLDIDQAINRPALPNGYLPHIAITVAGSPVSLEQVDVDRNIFYESESPGQGPALGAVVKADRSPPIIHPLHLGPDQFFCLGDNSPSSFDGRFWNTVDPWVLHYYLPGHTIEDSHGIVPRGLMMGRAFFVYWPAMYGLSPTSTVQLVPNFGDMRFIH